MSSGLSVTSPKITGIREVLARDVCDDLPMAATVLVVDDHPSSPSLRCAGCSRRRPRRRRRSGRRRLGAHRGPPSPRPDVVLLDVLLPDTTGFEVAQALAAGPERPLVVLTSSRSAADLGGFTGHDGRPASSRRAS